MKLNDLTGLKFNRLTVIKRLPSYKGKVLWLCICECGGGTIATTQDIVRTDRRAVKSCGNPLHWSGSKSKFWSGSGEVSGSYFSALKASATKRGYAFTVTIEYIAQLLSAQDGKCALSGIDIGPGDASLDRIDSTQGYIEGNLQWLHKDVNRIKSDFPEDRFIEICKAITERNKNVS